MPPQQQTDIHDDPDFQNLPLGEKHKALMAEDADYRGLPPSEQAKYLDEIHYGNLGRDESQFTGGTRNRIADAIDKGRAGAERGVTSFMRNFGLPTNEREVSHFLGQEPGQKPALSEMIDAGPRALPVIGPSYQASDDLRAGKYPEAAGDIAAGVAGAAPFRGPGLKLSDAVGAAARTPDGGLRPTLREGIGATGAYAGGAAMRGVGGPSPYIGAGIGYKTAPALADAIIPERAPQVRTTPFRQNIEQSNWTPEPEGEEQAKAPSAKAPKPPKLDPFQGATSSANPQWQGSTPKPKMNAKETGEYLRSKGRSTGKLREDIENMGTGKGTDASKLTPEQRQELESRTGKTESGIPIRTVVEGAPAQENLSAAMKRKVGESEGRYDARRMAKAGALRDEDSRTTPSLHEDLAQGATQGATERPSLSDAVSDAPKGGKTRPVSRKGQDLPNKKAPASTRGEDFIDEITRRAPGKSPIHKSVERKFKRVRKQETVSDSD